MNQCIFKKKKPILLLIVIIIIAGILDIKYKGLFYRLLPSSVKGRL